MPSRRSNRANPVAQRQPRVQGSRRRAARPLRFESLETRNLLAVGDVRIEFEFLDTGGTPVSSLNVGTTYTMRVSIQDARTSPGGILKAYFDLVYPTSLASVEGAITHGSSYNLATAGDTTTAGLIDEVGGFDTDAFPPSSPGNKFLLFSVPIRAQGAGTLTFTPDPADNPVRSVQFFDLTIAPVNEITFTGNSIQVIGASVNVSPTAGLTTTEAGGTATFQMVLTQQPTANVAIGLSSNDTTEGTVSPARVTFTSANWNTPQAVTVTGQNDFLLDGNITYSIITAAATSSDPAYNGLNPPNVSVTNSDNDVAGINVTPTTGLATSEAGGTASFSVTLTSQPTANVTINLSSGDTMEGTVSPTSITFTPGNFNTAQTVTVTGVDDFADDGDIGYTITTAPAVSTDPSYSNRDAADVAVTNTDNDTAGISVTPPSGLVTTEAGGTATFNVVLTSQPTANVTINLTTSDGTEGTVSPASITFTTANFNSPRTVTVTGVNDVLDDGDVAYTIFTSTAISSDPLYSARAVPDVAVTNTDDDTAGINVSPTAGLTVTEAGGTATLTIVLTSQPAANVIIGLTSNDTTEGTVSPSSVTFTSVNFATPRTITVTGVDDLLDDDDVAFAIITAPATSADPVYNGINAADVSVTNSDNDTAGINVTPTSGLVTTEAGGTALFSVVLASQPTANVTIGLSSNDGSEGSVSPASLTFTAGNWNAPQVVTVTGVDDSFDDGNVSYSIVTAAATSSDAAYNGLNPADVSVTNTDDDTVGIVVSPTTGLVTTEAGGTSTFTIRLATQPTANVVVNVSSSDATEGSASPAAVTFTPANFATPQTVTITGVDDQIDDGDVAYTINTAAATSTDTAYNGLNPPDVSVTNTDNDSPGATVAPTGGLVTTEAGGTATFTIRLNTPPAANVTIGMSSSDATEGTVSPASVTFTSANFSTPQTITVAGVDDRFDDGAVSFTVVTASATSTDPSYSGLNAADVSVTNDDNDVPGFIVVPTSGLVTSEDGGTATFQVSLMSQPQADVAVALSTSNSSEGTVSPANLVFTPGDFDTPQTVTVTGVNGDAIVDGDVAYQVITAPATSTDPSYSGRNPADVAVTNRDNDVAGFTVVPTSGLVSSEASGAATFQIALTSQPTADVTIGLSSSDSTEGAVSPASVTFTPANWSAPQTVTVQGQDDSLDDGNVAYTIVTVAATSADAVYSGLNPSDVGVSNTDDDVSGFLVVPTSGLVTTEAGGTATFQISLTSQPTADLTVALASSDLGEGTVSPGSVTFTSANWNNPQSITVTGIDELIDDGDVEYAIVTAPAVSSDAGYNGLNPSDVSVTNADNDQAGFTVAPTSGLVTSEPGGTSSFQVSLTAEPVANVVIGLSSNDTTEGTVAPSNLTFTPQNWNVPQVVTVTGVDDLIDDDDVTYQIMTAAATSTDPSYDGRNPDDVSVTNTDDDIPAIVVTPRTGLVTTESGGTAVFEMFLSSQPMADVVVAFASNDLGEGSLATTAVTFTPENWDTPRMIAVTGVDDGFVDGDREFFIITAPAVSQDPTFNGLDPADVQVTNEDNDAATLTLSPPSALLEGTGPGTTAFTFQATLSFPVEGGFSVAYSTNDRTATAAEGDYTDNDGTLHFNGTADESLTIVVQVVRDNILEKDEQFEVALGQLTNVSNAIVQRLAVVGSPASATILNDDSATVTMAPVSVALSEGTGGTDTEFRFQVTLSAPVQGGFDLDFLTNDGTATLADGDYIDNDGTLSFLGTSDESRAITVRVPHDRKVESDESFAVVLGQPTYMDASLVANLTVNGSPAMATIVNDDTTTLSLAAVDGSQLEGHEGATTDFTFLATLSDPVQGGFRIAFQANDGTATVADGDYIDNDGTLNFTGASNEVNSIVVRVNPDRRIEPHETFQVSLRDFVNLDPAIASSISITGSPITANVLNDDFPRLVLTSDVTTVSEGTGGGETTIRFTVTLSDSVNDPDGFDVAYRTEDGSATATGGDYVDNDGTLHFTGTAGESQTITVRMNRDAVVEPDESFNLSLGPISGLIEGETVVIDGGPITATIVNDDTATVEVAVMANSQLEGTGAGITEFPFEVFLSAAVQGGLRIAYTTDDGTARLAALDYVDTDGELEFAGTAGERHTVSVLVNRDNVVELDESFAFNLGDFIALDPPLAASISLGNRSVTATIRNDDTSVLSLSAVATSRAEGSGNVANEFAFQVALSNPVQGGFSIAYATNDGTATTVGGDYTDRDGSLSFAGGAGESQTVAVPVTPDTIVERDERLTFTLGQPTGIDPALAANLTVQGGPVEVTILNDDAGSASFASPDSDVLEATAAHAVDVVLSVSNGGTISADVVVNVTVLGSSSAESPDDFTLNTTTITFPAGSRHGDRRPVNLTLVVDEFMEEDETINLQLALEGDGIGGGIILDNAQHTVSVVDDPLTGRIAGRVWIDTNNNRLLDDQEMGLPGVMILLKGQDSRGQVVEINTLTAANGSYDFDRLPGGTYRIVEVHPTALHDGVELLGTVGGAPNGQVGADEFSGIVLQPTQQGTGYDFAETSLKAKYVTNRHFLASTSRDAAALRGLVADAESQAGNAALAETIRRGEAVEVRRIGSQVSILGTSKRDLVTFTPADDSGPAHQILADGRVWSFPETDVRSFIFDGAGGNDELKFDDSASDDELVAASDRARFAWDDDTAEVVAFELVRAISNSGGDDEAADLSEATDYVLRLEGNWVTRS